ncbi:MAG TPA: hypothetical protein VFN65_03010 [Solirubrobacteraceae bacterium]|nr:hypothetical protein [Solirubrobacteraceae bacterium]
MTELITHPRSSLARFDGSIERRLGFDARLLYGFSAPVVVMGVLISLMMLVRNPWAVAAAMIVEVLVLGLVVAGFMNVLDEGSDAD